MTEQSEVAYPSVVATFSVVLQLALFGCRGKELRCDRAAEPDPDDDDDDDEQVEEDVVADEADEDDDDDRLLLILQLFDTVAEAEDEVDDNNEGVADAVAGSVAVVMADKTDVEWLPLWCQFW